MAYPYTGAPELPPELPRLQPDLWDYKSPPDLKDYKSPPDLWDYKSPPDLWDLPVLDRAILDLHKEQMNNGIN